MPKVDPAPCLEARELVVAQGGKRVLDRVSLIVNRGEIAAIEGSSGSGKTTLLRALALLVEPTAGGIFLEGQDARTIAPRAYRVRVAYLAQQPAMFLQQLESDFVVALGERAVADHVGKHNGGELALFGRCGRHPPL